jgi:hypothetical protein
MKLSGAELCMLHLAIGNMMIRHHSIWPETCGINSAMQVRLRQLVDKLRDEAQSDSERWDDWAMFLNDHSKNKWEKY